MAEVGAPLSAPPMGIFAGWIDYLDLVDTSVTAEALARFHVRNPEVSLYPRSHQGGAPTTPVGLYGQFRLP